MKQENQIKKKEMPISKNLGLWTASSWIGDPIQKIL